MNWERKLTSLRNPEVKRIRKSVSDFSASFQDKEVPLDAPVPTHGGYCRRPLPYDYLYIVGTNVEGKEETIMCGLYSSDLLKAIREHIDNNAANKAVQAIGDKSPQPER